ncbi:MAG: hydroxyisourate hydrolase [Kiritimatiellae bacterium]|nr:hydroxyisourate hydrolase [Kiritimatiellia bacterium]MDW8458149.1 hydroxyisourate hydrolase [Verrucomicrobiota bacterium]
MACPITVRLIDSTDGRPAAGIHVVLQFWEANRDWRTVTETLTGADGGSGAWLPDDAALPAGTYRLMVDTRAYFQRRRAVVTFPLVPVVFDHRLRDPQTRLCILLSPHGYTAYRE